MSADKQIEDILARYGELVAGNIWRVQGQAVIYHKTLERIAAQAKIAFDLPIVLRAETEEAVVLVAGRIGERLEWSIGEARIGMNYRVSGRQAAYPYAMAEKRAKDRVILKLIELHGLVYSEEEADEFRSDRQQVMQQAIDSNEPVDTGDGVVTAESALARKLEGIRAKIESHKRADTLETLMKSEDTQAVLRSVGHDEASELRTYAWTRLKALRDSSQASSDPSAYARAKEGV